VGGFLLFAHGRCHEKDLFRHHVGMKSAVAHSPYRTGHLFCRIRWQAE